MARIVLTDVEVTVNSVDLSDHIASVTIDQSFNEVTTTAFGDSGVTRIAGLEDSSISLEFHQDFAASSVDATLNALVGQTTSVVVKPTSSAVSATNPSYTMTCLVSQWNPISGGAGDLSTVSVTWPVSGAITRAES